MSSKYSNRKAMVYGQTFDSTAEARYYLILRSRLAKGEIRNLQTQVRYELIPKQTAIVNGKKETWHATGYKADFVYDDLTDMQTHVVDVKGCKTEVYRLKKKLMLEKHGIVIEEVKA